ncbi:MAG: UDP-N-acetylglucosamine--N-acetylmuramyl-(pentapeptide) pyrophosphoryl-undecaprenol N-acetylglucosamine transferase, partial [Candidatus Sumerlaeia bacterium]|nr:UDP-N-acetylglucosamine--N-acetylmuramyl-(pentapeptide) pyrophosphoryl-undecaprenol N-acetylglucosamine transferase [Candidatus Sumerlaeia bacterium]
LQLESIAIKAFPFIERMDLAYAVTSFAMSRAGASTIAELATRSVPAILFPLAQAKDNHQFYNAQQLVQAGGGILIEERSANSRRVAEEIVDLIKRPARLQQMRECAGKFAKPTAAENIAAELISQLSGEK